MKKLTTQKQRVAAVLCSSHFYTLEEAKHEITRRFGKTDTEAAISARFRDLKKTGQFTCYKRKRESYKNLWEYRLEQVGQ
ncbi:hypothetical protein [Algicola sagamiensis]|uniref:hypothetical protein n=1 Tax=Algicola sagamiensis TaxID=163869 RepID=UPI000369CD2C|nr:hypothetical protein [Algicola sagamiensis]